MLHIMVHSWCAQNNAQKKCTWPLPYLIFRYVVFFVTFEYIRRQGRLRRTIGALAGTGVAVVDRRSGSNPAAAAPEPHRSVCAAQAPA